MGSYVLAHQVHARPLEARSDSQQLQFSSNLQPSGKSLGRTYEGVGRAGCAGFFLFGVFLRAETVV